MKVEFPVFCAAILLLGMACATPNLKPSSSNKTNAPVPSLSSAEVDLLEQRFRASPLRDKHQFALDIGRYGGESALTTLREPLENLGTTDAIGREEFWSLAEILDAIGVLARRSDRAFGYLRSRTAIEAWEAQDRWPTYRISSPGPQLAGRALMALALSGQPEFESELQISSGRTRDNPKYDPTFVLEAATRAWLVRTFGLEACLKERYSDTKSPEGPRGFYKTDEGKKWWNWYQAHPAQRGLHRPLATP